MEGYVGYGLGGVETEQSLAVKTPCFAYVFHSPFMKYRLGQNELKNTSQLKHLKTLPLKIFPWSKGTANSYSLLEMLYFATPPINT